MQKQPRKKKKHHHNNSNAPLFLSYVYLFHTTTTVLIKMVTSHFNQHLNNAQINKSVYDSDSAFRFVGRQEVKNII